MENGKIKQIFLIQQYTKPIIASINYYLDYIYNLKDEFYDDNDQLNKELEHDEEAEGLINRVSEKVEQFEIIRAKLTNDDFNLSTAEISYIGIALLFYYKVLQIKIARENEALELSKFLVQEIFPEGTKSNI